MAEDVKLERKDAQRDENNNYEAPRLQVVGKVDQLTSELDGICSNCDSATP